MFCPKCGREIPDGAQFCTYCGAVTAEPAPRHAKPAAQEELYSYSDETMPRDADEFAFNEYQDQTRVFDPTQPSLDETKVYNFAAFEDPNNAYPGEPVPYMDDRDLDPHDSYEMYQDGEDDETFMDKIDNRFRNYDDEEDDEKKKKNLTWLWIAIIAFLLVLLIVFGILLFTGALTKKDKNAVPTAPASATVATTAPATLAPTQAETEPEEEEPTEAPETYAPETYAPATEAPAPVVTDPPAPVVTDPPVSSDDSDQTSSSNVGDDGDYDGTVDYDDDYVMR